MKQKQNKNKKSSSGRARQGRNGGDIPPRAMRTYHTSSCSVPLVTEECVVRGIQVTSYTAQATSAQNPTIFFTLGNANVGSGFWDQYKIEAIRLSIVSANNAIGLLTNSTTTTTPLYCVIDYDDASALGSAAAAEAYSNCVVLNPGESMERVFQPRMALAAYTGTFVGFANVEPQWCDAASTSVQHYGLKLYIPGVTAAQTQLQVWDVTIEYFIRMRKAI